MSNMSKLKSVIRKSDLVRTLNDFAEIEKEDMEDMIEILAVSIWEKWIGS